MRKKKKKTVNRRRHKYITGLNKKIWTNKMTIYIKLFLLLYSNLVHTYVILIYFYNML